jgi:hypothetical protein
MSATTQVVRFPYKISRAIYIVKLWIELDLNEIVVCFVCILVKFKEKLKRENSLSRIVKILACETIPKTATTIFNATERKKAG